VQVAIQNLETAVRDFATMNDPAAAAAIGHALYIPARLGWVAVLHHLPPGSPAPPQGLLPSRRRGLLTSGDSITTHLPCADGAPIGLAAEGIGKTGARGTESRQGARESIAIEHLRNLTDGVLSREIAGGDLFNVHPEISRMLHQLSPAQFEESMRTEFTLARATFEHLGKPNPHEVITGDKVYKAAERLRPVLDRYLGPKPAAPLPDAIATELDADIPEARIEILETHESGLYGKVYKGRQTALDRLVAVKIIRPDWPNVADAIKHAKAIVRAGTHRNIVTVHCVERVRIPGVDQPQPAMIMEWLDGENLGVRLGGPQFTETQVRAICIGVLDGVEHMHARGIAHGDLHLGNVIVDGACSPKIIDIDPNKENSLGRLSTVSREAAIKSDIEYCQNLVLRVFSHGPFSIGTRNRVDMELQQSQSIDDLRGVVDRGLQGEPGIAQHQPRIDEDTAAVRRFEQIRQSFESAVSESRFHDLKPDKAVLAVCLVPERDCGLNLNAIHGILPPLLETVGHYESETDRYTEISLAEGPSGKSVLDIDCQAAIRAASTLAIRGNAPPKLIQLTGTERCIRSGPLQKTLVHSLLQWVEVLRQSGVAGPLRLGVSLLAVQGWDLLVFDRELCNRPQREPGLSADPITIPSLDDFGDARVVFETLKPAFDDIARGFGRPEWPLGSLGIG